MKTNIKNIVKSCALILAIALSTSIMAQQGKGNGPGAGNQQCNGSYEKCQLPKLTADQQSKIDELRTAHMEKITDMRLTVKQLRLDLEVLEQADKPDAAKINTKIDELYAAKANIAKERSAHQQSVRALLTKEQIAYFDIRGHGKGHHNGNHGKRGAYQKHCIR